MSAAARYFQRQFVIFEGDIFAEFWAEKRVKNFTSKNKHAAYPCRCSQSVIWCNFGLHDCRRGACCIREWFFVAIKMESQCTECHAGWLSCCCSLVWGASLKMLSKLRPLEQKLDPGRLQNSKLVSDILIGFLTHGCNFPEKKSSRLPALLPAVTVLNVRVTNWSMTKKRQFYSFSGHQVSLLAPKRHWPSKGNSSDCISQSCNESSEEENCEVYVP